jgi:hypothetical protein
MNATENAIEKDYIVEVQKAVFVPEIDAVREFVEELKAEFQADRTLVTKFQDDPHRFLGDRGMNADLRMEWMVELGVPGAEFGCFILSCIITEIGDGGCLITEFTLPDLFG